ncbi:hypothetical protein COSHB9_23090 [Companilactobacillus alimentarius]|nr:hypothetical protein LAL01_07810 [Companilactobacillus alimentarius]
MVDSDWPSNPLYDSVLHLFSHPIVGLQKYFVKKSINFSGFELELSMYSKMNFMEVYRWF